MLIGIGISLFFISATLFCVVIFILAFSGLLGGLCKAVVRFPFMLVAFLLCNLLGFGVYDFRRSEEEQKKREAEQAEMKKADPTEDTDDGRRIRDLKDMTNVDAHGSIFAAVSPGGKCAQNEWGESLQFETPSSEWAKQKRIEAEAHAALEKQEVA